MQQAVPRSSNLNKRTPLEVYSEYANHRRFSRNRLRLTVVEGGIDKHALLQMGVNRTDWKIESVGTRDNVEATVEHVEPTVEHMMTGTSAARSTAVPPAPPRLRAIVSASNSRAPPQNWRTWWAPKAPTACAVIYFQLWR